MKRAGILCGLALLLAAAAPAQETEHVVKQGETLNGIANRAGVTADAIVKANGLKPPYPLRTGQKLAIPRKGAAKPKPAPASAPAPTGPEATEGEHIVREDETLGGIANRAGVPKVVIAEANGLAEPYTVKAGQKFVIPRQRTHVVGKDETGFGIAYRYGVSWKAIAVANGLEPDAKVRQGQKLLVPAIIAKAPPPPQSQPDTPAPGVTVRANGAPVFHWPLRGEVLLGFARPGMEGGHNGIDIASETGTPVKAAAGGKVVFAGEEPKTYGTMVVLEHTGGWHSAYGHLSAASVKVGQPVAEGDVVGKVGQTGLANQPALHFEIRKDNFPVDPASRIEGSPGG